MPMRDGRSGKPGSSGSASGEPGGWSEEAMRAGTGGAQSKSKSKSKTSHSGSDSHEGIEPHSGEPSGQTQRASEKDKSGLV